MGVTSETETRHRQTESDRHKERQTNRHIDTFFLKGTRENIGLPLTNLHL